MEGSSSGGGRLLEGGVVQQAHVGDRGALLKVREPGRTTFVLLGGGGLGIAEARVTRPDGSRAVAPIVGFRVAWVTSRAIGLCRMRAASGAGNKTAEATEERARLDAERDGRVKVIVGKGAWTDDDASAGASAWERGTWLVHGETLARVAVVDALEGRRAAALRAVKRAVAKIERRAEAVRRDLTRIGEADSLAARAQWLVAEAGRAPRGATSLRAVDWSTGEAVTIEIPLDPSKPAHVQVDAMFQRARRLKLGGKVAGERLQQAETALVGLSTIAETLGVADAVPAIDDAVIRARALAPKDFKLESQTPASGAARGQPRSAPFRTFHARSGSRILVGRGAAHNDALTFQIARPHDLWLHAKGEAGAHVIVPLVKNHPCPGDLLADAAHLAAHFSKARDEAIVDVQYATRRHLRKPRGSAPGLVVVDREKVIAVRMEPATLRALLESEEI